MTPLFKTFQHSPTLAHCCLLMWDQRGQSISLTMERSVWQTIQHLYNQVIPLLDSFNNTKMTSILQSSVAKSVVICSPLATIGLRFKPRCWDIDFMVPPLSRTMEKPYGSQVARVDQEVAAQLSLSESRTMISSLSKYHSPSNRDQVCPCL